MEIKFDLGSSFDTFFKKSAACWEKAVLTSSAHQYLYTIVFLGTTIELGLLILANTVKPGAIFKENGHTISFNDSCKILRNDASIFKVIDTMFFPLTLMNDDRTCLSEIKKLRNCLVHNYSTFETEEVDEKISDSLLVLNYMMTLIGKIPIAEYENKKWLINEITERREDYRISPVLAERMKNILYIDQDNYFDFPNLDLIGNICENCGCEHTISVILDEIKHLIVQCIICLQTLDLKICERCNTAFFDYNSDNSDHFRDEFICEICLENLLRD